MKMNVFAADIKKDDVLVVAGTNYLVENDVRESGQNDEYIIHLRINKHTSSWIEIVALSRTVFEVFRPDKA